MAGKGKKFFNMSNARNAGNASNVVEAQIERAVVKYFVEKRFLCLPTRDTTLKTKFSFEELGKSSIPDIVAFRWDKDELYMDFRAVECKDAGTFGEINSALEQARLYKKHFPWCYIATAEPREDILKDIAYLRDQHHIGFIYTRDGEKVILDEDKDIYPDYLNYDLDQDRTTITRQKLLAIDLMMDRFKDQIIYGFEGNQIWVSSNEMVQYQLSNQNQEGIIPVWVGY